MRIFAVLMVSLAMASALQFRQVVQHFDNELLAVMDADKDSRISLKEAQTYFASYDTNRDGVIEFGEFADGLVETDVILQGYEHTLYNLFDQNSDGEVTNSDIVQTFQIGDLNNDDILTKGELNRVVSLTTRLAARLKYAP